MLFQKLFLNFFAMSLFKKIKSIISSADMFYSSDLLRFDQDTQYKTFTGGLITLTIIIMVVIGFASMITSTLNRTAITSTLNSVKSRDPPFFQLIPSLEKKFMFGLQIQSIDLSFMANLNSGPRFFDVKMQIQQISYGVLTNMTDIPLVRCTDKHWEMIPEIVQKKQLYNYDAWLCPQIGQKLPLQGIYTSQTNSLILITVGPCKNQTNSDMLCAPQEQIDLLMNQYTNFYVTVNYINSVINPTETNYISYYLEGEDYVIFSQTQGSEAWISFSDYLIQTDESILPFSSLKTDKGVIVQNKAINHPFSPSDRSGYVNIFFQKSANSLYYNRSVQKISAVFSYIGGLVGALTAVLFLLKTYTDTSLQITIAFSLFKDTQQTDLQQSEMETNGKEKDSYETPINAQGFNFFSFLQLTLYNLFSSFHFVNKLKKAKQLAHFQQEILHQLDIKTLLRRIISIQNCIQNFFSKEELQTLKFTKNVELLKARELRMQLVPSDIKDISLKKSTLFFSNKIADSAEVQRNIKQLNKLSPINFIESGFVSELQNNNIKNHGKSPFGNSNDQYDCYSEQEGNIPQLERYGKMKKVIPHSYTKNNDQQQLNEKQLEYFDQFDEKFTKNRLKSKIKTYQMNKSFAKQRGKAEKLTERVDKNSKAVQFNL